MRILIVEDEVKLANFIKRALRRKLEEGGEPRVLHTVRTVGYVLKEPESAIR